MSDELKIHRDENIISSKINEGFPNSWIFNIPIDLSFSHKIPNSTGNKEDLSDIKTNLSDNISQNYLPGDLINSMSNFSSISSEEEWLLDIQNKIENSKEEILTKSSMSTSRFYSPFSNQNNEENSSEGSFKENLNNMENEIKESKLLSYREDKGKVEENIYCSPQNYEKFNFSETLLNGKMTNGCDVQPIQSYNINIYNPNINCVNICSPPVSGPFSSFQQDNNQIFKENNLIFNEEEFAGKLPFNFYYDNSQNILRNIPFNNENNNINFLINSSINNNNLGDNFPAYFSETNNEQNLIFNKDVNIDNTNNSNLNENQNNEIKNPKSNNTPKSKKNKKKKKKKIDDEYTVEMFGRRGWICEECNNFNYDSRKKCNRCKIPKKPLKKTVIMDNKGNKIVEHIINVNHKDDWNCYNCGNVNYAFRLSCNRCQKKRDDEHDKTNKKINKLEN